MNFKVGNIVKFIKKNNYHAAQVGATAIIKHIGHNYISIKWIRNNLDNGQYDGEYLTQDFELVRPKFIGLCDDCGGINQHELTCNIEKY